MSAVGLAISDTPPSLNRAGTRGSHWLVSKAKRRWQADLELLLLGSGLPRGLQHVSASATLRFPTRRRRDAGNYSWLLEKALGDALVNGRWLADDTPEFFEFSGVSFSAESGPHQTIVSLVATKAAERAA